MRNCQLIFFLLVLVFSYLVTLDYVKLALPKKPFRYLKKAVTKLVPSPTGPFNYFKLAQQWPPSICKSGGYCPQFFTIHGLWPTNFTDPHSHDCTTERFKTDPKLLQRMNHYWPDLENGTNERFWSYQWGKHGTCAKGYNQTAYFTLALDLTNSSNLIHRLQERNITPGANYPAQKISNAISNRLKSPVPDLFCKGSTLHEIRICFNNSATISAKDVIKCPNRYEKVLKKCSGDIYFPS